MATRPRTVRLYDKGAPKRVRLPALSAEIRRLEGMAADYDNWCKTAPQTELLREDQFRLKVVKEIWPQLERLREQKYRLENNLPEPEPPAEPVKAAAPRPPPLPFTLDLTKVGKGENPSVDGRRGAEEMERFRRHERAAGEAMENARKAVAEIYASRDHAVSYTQGRHMFLELRLMSLTMENIDQREAIEDLTEKFGERLAALEDGFGDVLKRGLYFAGVWQRSLRYETGSAVTHQGSLWAAIKDVEVGEAPGEASCWQLAAKRGTDGKDFDAPARRPA